MPTQRRASAIAGRGLFTAGALASGAVVDADPQLLNHSCDPSLVWAAEGTGLVAFRDIAAGEELTIDYATGTTDPEMLVRCHCETYRCRQLVTGDDWQLLEVQRRYAGHFATDVQHRIDTLTSRP